MATGRDFDAASKAYQKFAEALKELDAAKRMFEVAGLPLPDQLKEFFGLHRNGRGSEPSLTVMPPTRSHKPHEANDEWISIPVADATATSLVLAILRQAGKPVPARNVVDLVTAVSPFVTRGSINNIGTRLSGTLIKREDDGWSLLEQAKAGLLDSGYLWGPKEIFDKQELAAHRREAILHILRSIPGGLQTVQIVQVLRMTEWVLAPASKDLVKSDMELLEGHDKVRRSGNSKKWVIRED